jgi:hypothetical protein
MFQIAQDCSKCDLQQGNPLSPNKPATAEKKIEVPDGWVWSNHINCALWCAWLITFIYCVQNLCIYATNHILFSFFWQKGIRARFITETLSYNLARTRKTLDNLLDKPTWKDSVHTQRHWATQYSPDSSFQNQRGVVSVWNQKLSGYISTLFIHIIVPFNKTQTNR